VNWTVESRSLPDSRAGLPKKNISEGERGVRNTWIMQPGVDPLNNAPPHEAV